MKQEQVTTQDNLAQSQSQNSKLSSIIASLKTRETELMDQLERERELLERERDTRKDEMEALRIALNVEKIEMKKAVEEEKRLVKSERDALTERTNNLNNLEKEILMRKRQDEEVQIIPLP